MDNKKGVIATVTEQSKNKCQPLFAHENHPHITFKQNPFIFIQVSEWKLVFYFLVTVTLTVT